ncbi:MAG TPA: 3D domain-containing protein [Bacillota bacterium]|nr:3D domain-containing protein [Bacillota bacterium]
MNHLRSTKSAPLFKNLTWVVAVVMLLLIGFGDRAYALETKSVTLLVDNKPVIVKTTGTRVSAALKAAKIVFRQGDAIYPGLEAPLKDGMKVQIWLLKKVTLIRGGKSQTFWTLSSNVKAALAEKKAYLGPQERTNPGLEARLNPYSKNEIRVVVDKTRPAVPAKPAAKPVPAVQAQAPAVTTTGTPTGGTEVKTIQEAYSIPYKVVTKQDQSLLRGAKKVLTAGVAGQGKRTVEVTIADGKEISRVVKSAVVVKAPTNQVLAVGTARTVSRGGVPASFKSSRVLEATGYTYTGHRTASGKSPARGMVAIDPRLFSFGTKFYIEGYGYAVAEDTGGAIVGNHIDLFFETKWEAQQWGRRKVRVYILE